MSNTMTEILARTRRELSDTGSPPVWTDTDLKDLLTEANYWYSRKFPRVVIGQGNVAAGDRSFTTPSGIFDVLQVECPTGRILPRDEPGPIGDPTSIAPRQRQGWFLRGEPYNEDTANAYIYLRNPAAGDEVGTNKFTVKGLGNYDLKYDGSADWGGPLDDTRLLVLWATKEALAQLDAKSHKRGRDTDLVTMINRYEKTLTDEVATRKRRLHSRTLIGGF